MQVDYNNLRVQAMRKFNEIVTILNHSMLISPHAKEVANRVNELKSLLHSIACCYKDGDPEIKSVHEEVELQEMSLTRVASPHIVLYKHHLSHKMVSNYHFVVVPVEIKAPVGASKLQVVYKMDNGDKVSIVVESSDIVYK